MTAPLKHETVCVTGANAFYAYAILDRMIAKGYKIHGCVRSQRSADALKAKYGDQMTTFITPDICQKDAFLEAVKGCDAMMHLASPFKHHFDSAEEEFLKPALEGALSALIAADTEPKMKRVVFTSSVASVLDPTHPTGFHRPGYTYTEKDWNPMTYEMAAPLKAFPPVYTTSKKIAEEAAWNFMKEKKRHFDLVCINPCHTWGKYTQPVTKASEMNMTNSDLSKLMDGEEKELPRCIMPWIVDIASVADAHISGLETETANGRYIIANAPLDFQQVVDILYDNFGDADWISNVPRGNPGKRQLGDFFQLDNTRSKDGLGIVYGDIKQSVIDFAKQYEEERKKF